MEKIEKFRQHEFDYSDNEDTINIILFKIDEIIDKVNELEERITIHGKDKTV